MRVGEMEPQRRSSLRTCPPPRQADFASPEPRRRILSKTPSRPEECHAEGRQAWRSSRGLPLRSRSPRLKRAKAGLRTGSCGILRTSCTNVKQRRDEAPLFVEVEIVAISPSPCKAPASPDVEIVALSLERSVFERPSYEMPVSRETPVAQPPSDDALAQGCAAALAKVAWVGAKDTHRTCFHSQTMPPISIGEYMDRIKTGFSCSSSCYVLALMFIDRLIGRQAYITINRWTVHRLLLTSMVVAAKVHDDRFYTNKLYAEVGGVEVQDLNRMEARFLKLMDWTLHVQADEFDIYSNVCRNLVG